MRIASGGKVVRNRGLHKRRVVRRFGFAENDVSVVRDNARQLKLKTKSTGFGDDKVVDGRDNSPAMTSAQHSRIAPLGRIGQAPSCRT
jgi:hypothetical protein